MNVSSKCWPQGIGLMNVSSKCWPQGAGLMNVSRKCWPQGLGLMNVSSKCWPQGAGLMNVSRKCWPQGAALMNKTSYVGVKVQLGVEMVDICPALAYFLSIASEWRRSDAASLTVSEAAAIHVLLS